MHSFLSVSGFEACAHPMPFDVNVHGGGSRTGAVSGKLRLDVGYNRFSGGKTIVLGDKWLGSPLW